MAEDAVPESRALILPPLRRTESGAARFAFIVHQGQVDKAERPYIEHLTRVAARVLRLATGCPLWSDQERDEAAQIAWLHDVVEDGHATWGSLEAEGFGNDVIAGVHMLTKGGHEAYGVWIREICERGGLAPILVKLADVEDNSDPKRLAVLPEADRERLARKYAGVPDLLRAAAREKGWQE